MRTSPFALQPGPGPFCRLVAAMLCVGLGGGVAGSLAGCELEYREVPGTSTWDNFPQDPKPGKNTRANPTEFGYSVQLGQFTGPDRYAQAFDLIRRAREQTDLVDLRTEDDGQTTRVYLGRFKKAKGLDARLALKTARAARIDGTRVFADAQLIAIERGKRAITSPNDLRRHATAHDCYSLQIAIFTPATDHYRAAAEKLAQQLRDAGEEAYFYHGPNNSPVTVGVLTQPMAFEMVDGREHYGPMTRDLQQRFPHLLVDGQYPPADPDHPDRGKEPTSLIRIPSY